MDTYLDTDSVDMLFVIMLRVTFLSYLSVVMMNAMQCVTLVHVTVPSSAMLSIIIISAPVLSVIMLRVDILSVAM